MDKEDLKQIGAELNRRKRQLLNIDKEIAKNIEIVNESNKGDEVDMAEYDAERDLSFKLKNRGVSELKMIDEALKRVEKGEYGICAECGDNIPAKRLKVLPYSLYCIRCQGELEVLEKNS